MARILVMACAVLSTSCTRGSPDYRPTLQSLDKTKPPPAKKNADNNTVDPNLWLEEIVGKKQLTWVKKHNLRTAKELEADPNFAQLRDQLKRIYDSQDRIPEVTVRAGWLYHYRADSANPRGLWRRTTLAEYKKKEPRWETLLDIDALSKNEGESWVWRGVACLPPQYERCLMQLSPGGADATVVREFDIKTKAFVPGGFTVSAAKTQVGWRDIDSIYIGTDFGPGSLTKSGYPRIAKLWKRGTPLQNAKTIFEGKQTDISVSARREFYRGKVRDWISRTPTLFSRETFLLENNTLERIEKPGNVSISVWDDQLLLRPGNDWRVGQRTWPNESRAQHRSDCPYNAEQNHFYVKKAHPTAYSSVHEQTCPLPGCMRVWRRWDISTPSSTSLCSLSHKDCATVDRWGLTLVWLYTVKTAIQAR